MDEALYVKICQVTRFLAYVLYVCCRKRTDTFSDQIIHFALIMLSSFLFDETLHWIIILQGECWYLLVVNVGLH